MNPLGTPKNSGNIRPVQTKAYPSMAKQTAQSVAPPNPDPVRRRMAKIRLVMDKGK